MSEEQQEESLDKIVLDRKYLAAKAKVVELNAKARALKKKYIDPVEQKIKARYGEEGIEYDTEDIRIVVTPRHKALKPRSLDELLSLPSQVQEEVLEEKEIAPRLRATLRFKLADSEDLPL